MKKQIVNVVRGPNIKGENDDLETFVGVISAKVLVEKHAVPYRNATRGTGYQRHPNTSRISKLANELRIRRVDLPTAVLLSIREGHPEGLVEINKDRGVMNFHLLESGTVQIVDGQHRLLALKKLLKDKEEAGEAIPDIKIPFVCMIGADEAGEMKQFYVVNKNAKSVPTDLAFNLLRALAENDPELTASLIGSNQHWQITADRLAYKLADCSAWKGMVRLPNALKEETTIPISSVIRSLRGVLALPSFEGLGDDPRKVQLLNAVWLAVNKYIDENIPPEIAARYRNGGNKYRAFSFHTGIGVSAIHGIVGHLIELIRSTGKSLFEADSYLPLISSACEELRGTNGTGEEVSGIAFWQTGRKGAVGGYSSEAGKRILIEMLKSKLPLPSTNE